MAHVKPRAGYGKAINEKLQKINTMSRVARLMTGANKQYLTSDGISLRNFVWVGCMIQSIAQAVPLALLQAEINAFETILDQKTMAVPTRTFFEKQLRKIGHQLGVVLPKVRTRSA